MSDLPKDISSSALISEDEETQSEVILSEKLSDLSIENLEFNDPVVSKPQEYSEEKTAFSKAEIHTSEIIIDQASKMYSTALVCDESTAVTALGDFKNKIAFSAFKTEDETEPEIEQEYIIGQSSEVKIKQTKLVDFVESKLEDNSEIDKSITSKDVLSISGSQKDDASEIESYSIQSKQVDTGSDFSKRIATLTFETEEKKQISKFQEPLATENISEVTMTQTQGFNPLSILQNPIGEETLPTLKTDNIKKGKKLKEIKFKNQSVLAMPKLLDETESENYATSETRLRSSADDFVVSQPSTSNVSQSDNPYESVLQNTDYWLENIDFKKKHSLPKTSEPGACKFQYDSEGAGITSLGDLCQESESSSKLPTIFSKDLSDDTPLDRDARALIFDTDRSYYKYRKSVRDISDPKDEPDSPEITIAINRFLIKGKPQLQKIVEASSNVKAAIIEANLQRHDFKDCPHPHPSCLRAPMKWKKFVHCWDMGYVTICRAIDDFKDFLNRWEGKLVARKDINMFIDVQLALFEDMNELDDLCDEALSTYRDVCFNYDNYVFLTYANVMNIYLKPLIQKISEGIDKFSTLETEIKKIELPASK